MNRHSLFWKIFLSFWIFMVLFGICSALITRQLSYPASHRPTIPTPKIIMHTYELIQQDETRIQLIKWLEKLQHNLQSDAVYIIDSDGKDLLKRPITINLQQVLDNNHASLIESTTVFRDPNSFRGPPFFQTGDKTDRTAIIIIKLPLISGEHYILLIDNRNIHKNWLFWRSLGIGARIAIASLLSGIICFFLARYLTTPLKKLRTATHQIASGHFNSTIDSTIANRKDEIGDLGRDFDSMAKHIEITLQSQQRLLRDVSHELRSPLARLQIALGLAQKKSNGQIEPELQRIELEVERLNKLIGQSLSLTRLSNQTVIPEKSIINLCDLLVCVISNAEYEAQNKHCHIVTTEMTHCFIEGNWDLLHSAVENVLRNAIHYTKPGTTIETSISLSINTPPSVAIIKIRDHGAGVPETDLKKLFKPFFRVDEARTKQSGGYGIGLAITDRAIHLHNGTISVENAPDNGLIVSISLPI